MFFHLFPYFLRSDKSDTRTARTPRALSCENPQRQSIFTQALEYARFFASLMELTGWEAGLPGHQDGYLPF